MGILTEEIIGKYFGFYMFNGRVDLRIFNDFFDKSRNGLDSWKFNILLKVGKVVFIQFRLEVL